MTAAVLGQATVLWVFVTMVPHPFPTGLWCENIGDRPIYLGTGIIRPRAAFVVAPGEWVRVNARRIGVAVEDGTGLVRCQRDRPDDP